MLLRALPKQSGGKRGAVLCDESFGLWHRAHAGRGADLGRAHTAYRVGEMGGPLQVPALHQAAEEPGVPGIAAAGAVHGFDRDGRSLDLQIFALDITSSLPQLDSDHFDSVRSERPRDFRRLLATG